MPFITDPKLPVSERLQLLQRQEFKILDDVKDLDFSLKDTQERIKEIIHQWALIIEEQQFLGAYPKPIDTICTRIIQILRDNSLEDITSYTYSLPSRFKQAKYQNAGLFASAHKNNPFKSADDIVLDELESWRDLEKEQYMKNILNSGDRKYSIYLPSNAPIDVLSNDEIRRKHDLLKEAKSRIREELSQIEDLISEKHIALLDEKAENHIRTEKPEQRETLLYQAVGNSIVEFNKLIGTLEQLQEKVLQFPPSDDDAKVYAEAFNEFMSELIRGINEFIKPIKDEKFTNSWGDWYQTAKYEYDHGKHAAGKMSAEESHKGEMRPLTREIVGDSRDKVFDQALRFVRWVSMFNELTQYHKKYVKPRILDRKIRLSPILSEQA